MHPLCLFLDGRPAPLVRLARLCSSIEPVHTYAVVSVFMVARGCYSPLQRSTLEWSTVLLISQAVAKGAVALRAISGLRLVPRKHTFQTFGGLAKLSK